MEKCKNGCPIGIYEDTIDESTCFEIIEIGYNDYLIEKNPNYCVMFNLCPRCGNKIKRNDKCNLI